MYIYKLRLFGFLVLFFLSNSIMAAAASASSAAASTTPASIAVPPSPYILECRNLLLATSIPALLVPLILAYKYTTDAHAKAMEWIHEEHARWENPPTGQRRGSFSSPGESIMPQHFPIAGFRALAGEGYILKAHEFLFGRNKATKQIFPVTFRIQFFNAYSHAFFILKTSWSTDRRCKQYWSYDKETGRIHLYNNLPLGAPTYFSPHRDMSHVISENYDGIVDVFTGTPQPPHAVIPLEEGTNLHVVVVDHSPDMADPTKNRCFDYWIEKTEPKKKSECIVQ